ncbi:hypothetical protein OAK19_01700 [Aureispira]|nr:hypothetical protein [Aureispira sp.]
MKIKFQSFYLYVILCLFFLGCRGCSDNPPVTYILESIVEDIQIDSNNIARIQIEHLKNKNIGFKYKFKKNGGSASHVICYNLKLNKRPYRNEVFMQDAIATDSLDQYRHDINIILSKDRLHLLLTHENNPIGVYHLLDSGMPFTTSIDPAKTKAMAIDFAQNILQDPEDIMVDYVGKVVDFTSSYNNNYINKTLSAQKSPSSLDKKLFAYIGFPLADSYFTTSRITKLCASLDTKWRTKAIKKIYKIIGKVSRAKNPVNEALIRQADGAINIFTNGLDDYIDKRAIERQVLPKYPLYPYTIKLFNDSEEGRILRKVEVNKIEKNCIELLKIDSFRNALPAPKTAVNCAIEFLIRYRDNSNLKAFEESIASVFRMEILKLNPKTMDDEIFFPYSTRFSETEQKIILSYARKLANQIPEGEDYLYLDKFLKNID